VEESKESKESKEIKEINITFLGVTFSSINLDN